MIVLCLASKKTLALSLCASTMLESSTTTSFASTAAMVESSSLWSGLPPELLDSVFDCLNDLKDVLRSSSVCSSWKSSAALVYHRKFIPSLLVINNSAHKEARVLDPSRGSMQEESGNVDFAVDSDDWVCGCTRGFLLMIGVLFPYEVQLLNQFTKAAISLPPLTSLEDVNQLLQSKEIFRVSEILKSFVKKVVSSASPSHPECIVMIIYNVDRKLAFCRRKDKSWTDLEPDRGTSSVDDIVFYKGVFFAIDRNGELYYCELSPDSPKAIPIRSTTPFHHDPCKKYFAESVSGELCVVLKKLEYNDDDNSDFTISFAIYELDSGTEEWKRVRSLKGKALFLSPRGLSMAISAGKPISGGFIEDNSVYFTDDLGGSANLSVFGWESKQTKKLYQPSSWNSQLFWITPGDVY